jgi:alkylation response protein AidB-like acyl-CoA dehydrogenase
MDSLLSKKHIAIRRSVRSFCEREIVPVASQLDKEADFPWDIAIKMGKLGFFGLQVPTSLGGQEMDSLSSAIVIEEISRTCAGLGLCISVHNSVAVYPLMAFGSDEVIEKFVPPLATGRKIGAFCLTEPNAGSDASGIEATAIKDGDHYIVNANKVYVTNGGVADTFLIFARTDPATGRKGISVIIAERDMEGLVIGDLEDLCGMRANPVASVRMYDCKVPAKNLLGKEGAGLKIGLAGLDTGRIGIAAQALGIAQAALEAGVNYAKERHQFGVPIAKHQAIQMMIADMATQTETARLMVYNAASQKDSGKPFSMQAAMAKLFASEISSKVTDAAVQIHGGYGYSKQYHVERFYRDARITRIYEGSAEVHRMVIARGTLMG